MKEKKILLTSIEEAKRFVTEASRCDFDVDVFYNRFTIDAKSILGVLSLDLARVLTVQMNGENEEFEAYLETISPDSFNGTCDRGRTANISLQSVFFCDMLKAIRGKGSICSRGRQEGENGTEGSSVSGTDFREESGGICDAVRRSG